MIIPSELGMHMLAAFLNNFYEIVSHFNSTLQSRTVLKYIDIAIMGQNVEKVQNKTNTFFNVCICIKSRLFF